MANPTSTTMLVVDDSVFEHQIIAQLLQEIEGLRLVFSSGAAEALWAIEHESPDLILTDLIMPDMNGLQLVEHVRERYPSIPMILMTAFGSEEAAMRALRAGAANYLPKRHMNQDLAETVRQTLSATAVDRDRRRLLSCLDRRESTYVMGNEPDLIAPLMELIKEELDGLGRLDRMGRIRVAVALQEALTNALYHGNLEVSSALRQDNERLFYETAEARCHQEPYASRHIEVGVRYDRRAASFTIRDEGPGFDTSRMNRPIAPEDLLSIGGRGLLLIRTFMDEVVYNSTGNMITMTKRFL
jgi:CheY-like chemotaxis protein